MVKGRGERKAVRVGGPGDWDGVEKGGIGRKEAREMESRWDGCGVR